MIQFIRGDTLANDGYTGPIGSLSVDTQAGNIRLHDGQTPGGLVIANVDNAGGVKSVTSNSPIIISGTLANPVIEIQASSQTEDGYMSSSDKSKLDSIESGAEVNVSADWNADTGDSQILNKPNLGSAASSEDSDFATAAQGGNADTAFGWGDHADAGYELASNKGTANGYASLDGGGRVPVSQLPSFVEDVIETSSLSAFPPEGESGKIYVALDTGKTYRWSGSSYTEISSGDVNSVNGQTGVVDIPNADSTTAGLMSTGAQTFSGNKTFSGVVTIDEGDI